MKTSTILALSMGGIVLLLASVAAVVWWQNDFEDRLPISGHQVSVGLVPEDDVYISARYYASPGRVNNRGVILLHQDNNTQNAWNTFAAELQEENYEVVTLDFRGHGESSGNPAAFEKFIDDAAEAVEYLRDINSDMHIVMVGAGLGGNVALQLADRDQSLDATVLISPQYNYQGIKITQSNKRLTRPIYYLVSRSDEISAQAAQGLFDQNPSTQKELKIAEEADGHGTKLINTSPKLRAGLIDWLNSIL